MFIKTLEFFGKILIMLHDNSRNMLNVICKMLNQECDYKRKRKI